MRRILFLADDPRPKALSESARFAYAWAADQPGLAVHLVSFEEAGHADADLLWWHGAIAIGDGSFPSELISERVAGGTSLLLTGTALAALHLLDLEERPPRTSGGEPWDGPTGDRELYGHMTFAGHPSFEAFGAGAYTWRARTGVPVWDAWYHRDEDDPRGRIIAVERTYIAFDPLKVTGLSYDLGAGRVGALGAHLPFHDRRNPNRGHLERLVGGWIRWLAPDRGSGQAGRETEAHFVYSGFRPEARERCWPRPRPGIVEEPGDPVWSEASIPAGFGAPRTETFDAIWNSSPPGGLEHSEESDRDAFFDVGGRRHFIMGSARTGIREAWTGGVRLFRRCALRLGPQSRGSPDVGPADGGPAEVTSAHPGPATAGAVHSEPGVDAGVASPRPVKAITRLDGFRRELEVDGGRIREVIAAHPDAPGGLSLMQIESDRNAVLTVEVDADLRLMWPFPAGLLDPLRVSLPVPGVASVRGTGLEVWGALGLHSSSGPGVWSWTPCPEPDPSGEEGASTVRLRGCVDVPAGRSTVVLAWSVHREGARSVTATLHGLLAEPASALDSVRSHREAEGEVRLRLSTPGRSLGRAFEWAVARIEPFHLTTDGLGNASVAGYGLTGEGWLSGRPGYAWYFGRDAIFTALGALSLGFEERALDTLTFLADHQEWSGKILHEATPGGAVHYDAADATPLWLVLLGTWFGTTGKLTELRKLWPAARRAMGFCRRTDQDGDGLIENSGVGHGWIEGGRLYGAHVTNYLAGIWAAAQDAYASCADALGEASEARQARAGAERVRQSYEEIFWIPTAEHGTGHYALGMRRDRSLIADHTVMPSVAILFGQTDPERAREHLLPLAGEAFSADWGVRMIARDHPAFDPAGYHYGAIWPLYSGWTALAEYRVGRLDAAFSHLQSSLHSVLDLSPGNLAEVLHGLVYGDAGVCPHQAWSHALLALATVEGLIGWRPAEGPPGRVLLTPHIPEEWEHLEVHHLRHRGYRFTLRMEGSPGRRRWRIEPEPGRDGQLPTSDLRVRFAPTLPPEARVEEVIVDGRHVHAPRRAGREASWVEVDVDVHGGQPAEVELRYVYDLHPILPEPALEEGQPSRGWRLLDRRWEGEEEGQSRLPHACRLVLEGPPGTTTEIDLMLPGRSPKRVEGAEWARPPKKGKGRLRVTFPDFQIPTPGCADQDPEEAGAGAGDAGGRAFPLLRAGGGDDLLRLSRDTTPHDFVDQRQYHQGHQGRGDQASDHHGGQRALDLGAGSARQQ